MLSATRKGSGMGRRGSSLFLRFQAFMLSPSYCAVKIKKKSRNLRKKKRR